MVFKNLPRKNILKVFSVLALVVATLASANAVNSDLSNQDPQIITAPKQITFEGPKSGEGYYSRDGKKMIFQSERDPKNPFYQMFVLDLLTGEIDRISTGSGKTTCGWLHPYENKAMWSSTHLDTKIKEKVKAEFEERAKPVKGRYAWSFDEYFDIFESDLNGKKIKRLTKELGYDAEGSYSPDGKYIAFASNRRAYSDKLSSEEVKKLKQDPSYFMDIYIMKADGSDVKRLTSAPGYDGGPFFSADGKKITWRRFSESGASAEIYTMNVDGSEQKQITRLNSMSWAPFYHPSGDYIVFATTVGGYSNFELFIVDSEGLQKPQRVTFAEGFDGLASYSPDGKKITWSHRNEKGESQIYIADWDDAKARKLLNIKPSHQDLKVEDLSNLQPQISQADVKEIVQYLASEAMAGRYTGSTQEKIYTQKIAELFQKWGLKPAVGNDYIQTFEFISQIEAGKKNTASLMGRYTKDLKLNEDYQLVSYSKMGEFNSAPIVFAGYGIKAPAHSDFAGFDSYKNLDVKGKWVVILDDAPIPAQREFSKHTYLLSFSRLQHKITVAKNAGAFGVLVVEEQSKNKMAALKFAGSLSDSSLPVLKISSLVLSDILKNSPENKELADFSKLKNKYNTYDFVEGFNLNSQYFSAAIDLVYQKSTGRNVLAKIYPEDVKYKSKGAVIMGAHGDHLGTGLTGSSLASNKEQGQIHYGADDNASGVSGVLELAHYYSQSHVAKNLKRPLYFAIWSGEEIGVLGSSHFVKNYKDFSKKFVASLNMDMIGRLRESLNIQGVGSADGFKSIAEKASVKMPVALNLTSDPYLPTDSMALYLGGIPSISFFTGAHSEYHTPRDKPETLNYLGIVSVIEIVKMFTDEIGFNAEQVLSYKKVEGNSGQKLEGRSFRIFLGTIPDYAQEGVKGVRISGTAKNSPAEKAGLKTGDVIVGFDRVKIENIYDYVYVLQSVKADVKTEIVVLRDGKEVSLSIVPMLKE